MQFPIHARIERTRALAKQLEEQLLHESVEKNSWVQNRIVEQRFTVTQIRNASKNACHALIDSAVQHLLDQLANQQDIGIVAGFSDDAIMCLMNVWFRGCIAAKYLTLQELAAIAPNQAEALCDVEIQQLFGDGQNRKYIGLVVNSFDWTARALMQDWFRNCFPKKLAFEQLADVTEGGYDGLSEPKVISFLDQHPEHIGLFISLSQAAADALTNDAIWARVLDGDMNVEWFVNLDWDEYNELCGAANQNAIDQDEQTFRQINEK